MKIKKLQRDYNSEKEKRTEKENCESKLKTQLQIAEMDVDAVCGVVYEFVCVYVCLFVCSQLKRKLEEMQELNEKVRLHTYWLCI